MVRKSAQSIIQAGSESEVSSQKGLYFVLVDGVQRQNAYLKDLKSNPHKMAFILGNYHLSLMLFQVKASLFHDNLFTNL